MSGRRRYQWLLLLLVAGALLWWVLADGALQAEPERTANPSARSSTSESPSHQFTATTTPSSDPTFAPTAGTDPHSGLPIVQVADLPPEAAEILELIDRGGPSEADEDDETFRNDEETSTACRSSTDGASIRPRAGLRPLPAR